MKASEKSEDGGHLEKSEDGEHLEKMKTVGIWGGQHGAPKKILPALFKTAVIHFPEKKLLQRQCVTIPGWVGQFEAPQWRVGLKLAWGVKNG